LFRYHHHQLQARVASHGTRSGGGSGGQIDAKEGPLDWVRSPNGSPHASKPMCLQLRTDTYKPIPRKDGVPQRQHPFSSSSRQSMSKKPKKDNSDGTCATRSPLVSLPDPAAPCAAHLGQIYIVTQRRIHLRHKSIIERLPHLAQPILARYKLLRNDEYTYSTNLSLSAKFETAPEGLNSPTLG
jgi:hypothetical protein